MQNRREFLVSAAAVPLASSFAIKSVADTAAPAAVPEVPPFDPSRVRPADFSDADLDMPYNITYLSRIANAVETDGPDRGFINISVWRGTSQLRPYNARIMESILTLAWFYASPRKWNQYYANRALRARLELALECWCNLQSPDGKFSEYGPQQWNLPATAFAVKFISEALRLLKTGPPITPALHTRAVDCCRKAVHATLYDPDLISHGKSYSNQYTNIFAGGAAFLALYPDAELLARLKEQVEASPTELQSPCGYMYEADGPDLGYTLNTHHENLQMAYSYWRGTPLGDVLLAEEERWGKWLSYNLLPEPNQPFWVANRSIETRQQHSIFRAVDTPLADKCVIMRAFATPPERRAADIKAAREKLVKDWPHVAPLSVGEFDALSPYRFLQRAHYDWHPTAEQVTEALKLLRPANENSFVEQLKDSRKPITFTYVRRPGYYAAFASAPRTITKQQRLGLTLVWTPNNGVLMQSQTGGTETAWGTTLEGDLPVEATGLDAEYAVDNTIVHYALPGGGQKQVTFAPDRILVRVEREGQFVERIPVFDTASVLSDAQYTTRTAPVPAPRPSADCPNPEAACTATVGPVPEKILSIVELTATGKLDYEIRPTV
ncbi:MAG: hypothetical protein ACLPZY_08225 [Terracidiphilus sp.]